MESATDRPRGVLVIHGPSLNLLGTREPHLYGARSLSELDEELTELGRDLGVGVTCRQSNHEGEIIDWIHASVPGHGALIINPAGYTHTSVAIADALRAVPIPAVEVHLSHVLQREPVRQISYTAAACVGVIAGLGFASYLLALRHAAALVTGDFDPPS